MAAPCLCTYTCQSALCRLRYNLRTLIAGMQDLGVRLQPIFRAVMAVSALCTHICQSALCKVRHNL